MDRKSFHSVYDWFSLIHFSLIKQHSFVISRIEPQNRPNKHYLGLNPKTDLISTISHQISKQT